MLDNTAFLDRPIIDRTGLTASHEIQLAYTPENKLAHGEPEPADISVFDALPRQLGLRLVSQKDEVEFLVVDHAAKPAQN